MKATLAARFWAKVDRRGPGECWPWLGYVTNGYGKMYVEHINGRACHDWAHRIAWFLEYGEWPSPGKHVDHVRARGCGGGRCVNVAHLEVVTARENLLRADSEMVRLHHEGRCRRGHSRSEAVLRRSTGAVVYCKACRREDRAARRAAA